MERICPRSPREVMDGWTYLPRFVDKVRLHLAGKLHPDYQENFTKAFDARWLEAAGVTADQFIAVVKNTVTDGEVCDWVRRNVKRNPQQKAAHREGVLSHGSQNDPAIQARFKMRKEECGAGARDEIKTFVDVIDVDEGRL